LIFIELVERTLRPEGIEQLGEPLGLALGLSGLGRL
jgi:hypothetical protein